MKKFRNSHWLRAATLIPNSAISCYHSANVCYQCKFLLSQCKFVLSHFAGKKPLRKKRILRQGSPNSGNISSKFEVNSTLILPVKCPLTKLENPSATF